MESIKIKPSKLNGRLLVPPSKSLSHRAIICASLSKGEGESIINNIAFSEDINATISGMKKLGAEIYFSGNTAYIKRNKIIEHLPLIDCKESGSTLRFLIPISIILTDSCNFTGSNKLFQRPLDIYYDIFDNQHIRYEIKGSNTIEINGKLSSGLFEIPGNISSQFITGLLLALPLLEGNSKIIITGSFESKDYVDMTIDVMKKFGVNINRDNNSFNIKGKQKYINTTYNVEGDYSQAAFFLVANELGNKIECVGLNHDSLQGDKEILNIIEKFKNNNEEIEINIDASQIPDLVPIITVLAALKDNSATVITNAERLRIKESDRLKAISNELNKLGANVIETKDGLIIKGKKNLRGSATVNSWNDHRIAMSLAVAATKCEHEIILENHRAVNKSYPQFWKDYESLGGVISELNNRQ